MQERNGPPDKRVRGFLSYSEWNRRVPLPSDQVSLSNLSTTVDVIDGWGRSKSQPLLISLRLSLTESFTSAAVTDQVDHSTVHYGNLSKAILQILACNSPKDPSMEQIALLVEEATCRTVSYPAALESLEISLSLPKATLLGQAASFRYARAYGLGSFAKVLHLENLRIPTLIGVNSHEREMKQIVVANCWIDGLTSDHIHAHNKVEQILVKSIEESSYKTLESLVTDVVSIVIKYFIFPEMPGASVRLRVEKPSAVTFADAPAIEIVRSSTPLDPFAMRLWEECGCKTPPALPFPLKGTLGDALLG